MTITMPTTDVIAKAIALACRAPSLHNSQPWRWRLDHHGLDLFADPSRRIPTTDFAGRELLISCGVALDHAQAALAAEGWNGVISVLPNPTDPWHLAHIDVTPARFVTDAHRSKAAAILDRWTDRLPLEYPTQWNALAPLVRDLLPDDVEMTEIGEQDHDALVQIAQWSEANRRYDQNYHAELYWWAGHDNITDRIPVDAVPSQEEQSRVDIARSFPKHNELSRRTSLTRDHAVVVVLSTLSDQPRDVLACGQALSVVLLEATVAGMATCVLTNLVELPTPRAMVAKLIGKDRRPQVLVRIGLAPADDDGEPQMTPRRPLSDVLRIEL